MSQFSADKLRQAIETDGRGVYRLAEEMHYSPTAIYWMMNGKRNVTTRFAHQFAAHVGIPVDHLKDREPASAA